MCHSRWLSSRRNIKRNQQGIAFLLPEWQKDTNQGNFPNISSHTIWLVDKFAPPKSIKASATSTSGTSSSSLSVADSEYNTAGGGWQRHTVRGRDQQTKWVAASHCWQRLIQRQEFTFKWVCACFFLNIIIVIEGIICC